jgi:hypothetical protein
MSPNEALKSHWTAVFAGVAYHTQAPVEVEIVQDSEAHTIRVIPIKSRIIDKDDGTHETVETVKVMILKDPDTTHAPTSIFVGGLASLKLGTQMTMNEKKYVHTGDIPDDSDLYLVGVFERRFRSIQGRGNR